MELNEDVLKNELMKIKIRNIKVKKVDKNVNWREINEVSRTQLKDIFGQNLNFDEDLADFNHYSYPSIRNFQLANALLIFNIWGFLLDDYLDKNPEGN